MPALSKFNTFVADVGNKVHNLGSDTLKVALTNTAPVATNAVLADITEITAQNGYVAGGNQASNNTFTQTSGTAKLTANNVTFTASGGSFGPFRYIVLYNATPTSPNKPLIGWGDYGSALSVNIGDSFTVTWDAVNGILTLA